MKTPYLDQLIEILEQYKKKRLACNDQLKELNEYKSIKQALKLNSDYLFCPYCGNKREFTVSTDINSGRICKNRLCRGR